MRSSSILLLLAGAAFGLLACRHLPTEREQRGAQIHYDLGVSEEQNGDIAAALRDFQQALQLDDGFPEAHNAYALLLHLSFHRDQEAIQHYKRALEIRPTFSEAKVNLANVYLGESRYDEAIKLYNEALNDMLYPTPYIAQNNLGWALFQKGQVEQGIDNIRAALITNPKFCQGYRNLGLIEQQQGKAQEACHEFGLYHQHCPKVADASYQEAVCKAKLGHAQAAKDGFSACLKEDGPDELKDQCRAKLEELGGSATPAGQ